MGNLLESVALKKYSVYHQCRAENQWEVVTQGKSMKSLKIVRNRSNNSVLGQLHLSKQIGNLQNYLKILQFRHDFRQKQIVGVLGVYQPYAYQTNNLSICGKVNDYSIVTEHVKYCLPDLGQISLENSIHILKSSIKGAKLIKQLLKISTLYDQNMIFINNKNQCKIWINSDVNQYACELQGLNIQQEDIIYSIFQAVQQKMSYSSNLQSYFQLKQTFSLQTFDETLCFLSKFKSKKLQLPLSRPTREAIQKVVNNSPIENQIIQKRSIRQNNTTKKSLSMRKSSPKKDTAQYFSAKKNKQNRNLNTQMTSQYQHPQSQGQLNYKQSSQRQWRNGINSQLLVKSIKVPRDSYPLMSNMTGLKKQTLKREYMKSKFPCQFREQSISSKPLSNVSTHNESFSVRDSFLAQQRISINYENKQRINPNRINSQRIIFNIKPKSDQLTDPKVLFIKQKNMQRMQGYDNNLQGIQSAQRKLDANCHKNNSHSIKFNQINRNYEVSHFEKRGIDRQQLLVCDASSQQKNNTPCRLFAE